MFSSARRVADDRLHRFGLGRFLRGEPAAVEHVEKIGVPAGVQLIGALDFHAALAEEIDDRAMQNGRAQLRLNVVADERQIFFLKPLRPDRVAGDENRDVVDKSEPRFKRAAGIETGRFLRADRQIVDHDLGAGFAQLPDNLLAGRLFFQRLESAQRVVVAMCAASRRGRNPSSRWCRSSAISQKTLVQLGGAKMASLTSIPTLRRSISKAATTSMSFGW